MSTLDLLLGIDPSKLNRPTKEVEITRLSKAAGSKVTFQIQALSMDEEEEAREIATTNEVTDPVKVRIFTVLLGVTSPNLKDSKLLEKYGASTPKELLQSNKLLQSGEIVQLYNQISELSGYGENAIADLKNE